MGTTAKGGGTFLVLSVAIALSLHRAAAQRAYEGAYNPPRLIGIEPRLQPEPERKTARATRFPAEPPRDPNPPVRATRPLRAPRAIDLASLPPSRLKALGRVIALEMEALDEEELVARVTGLLVEELGVPPRRAFALTPEAIALGRSVRRLSRPARPWTWE